MTKQNPPTAERPLDELDRRQDEVLQQLDQLNSDVVALLDELRARLSSFSDKATPPVPTPDLREISGDTITGVAGTAT